MYYVYAIAEFYVVARLCSIHKSSCTYVVSERLHPAGEPLRVGLESAEPVPLVIEPAVVHVDVGVPHAVVSVAHQQVGHLLEQTLAERETKETVFKTSRAINFDVGKLWLPTNN